MPPFTVNIRLVARGSLRHQTSIEKALNASAGRTVHSEYLTLPNGITSYYTVYVDICGLTVTESNALGKHLARLTDAS